MPSPKNASRTMAEVRAECIALGVQPGRSVAECETRIAERKAAQAERAADAARIETEFAQIGAWPQGVKALPDPVPDNAPDLTEKTRKRERAKRVARLSPALAAPYGTEARHAGDAKRGEELAEVRAKLLPEDRWPPEAEARAAEKTARHAANHRSGAALFLSATAALGQVRTSPDLREMARAFDRAARNKPRASVPGSVRRKMQRDASKEGR